jgi:hypothetical protein
MSDVAVAVWVCMGVPKVVVVVVLIVVKEGYVYFTHATMTKQRKPGRML